MRDIRVRNLPMGYGFRPKDIELLGYLQMKIQGFDSEVDEVIAELDICEFEPWNLPDKSKIKSDEQEWFFISPPVKKYPNSKRINRATNFGHWKVTGKERNITDQTTKTGIGKKRTLVFYEGRCSSKKTKCSKKTDWVLHEYRLIELLPNQKELALYLLRNKCEDCEPSSHGTTDFEDQATDDATPKTYTPNCDDYGPSSNVTTDFEYQARFEHDMNAEALTLEAIYGSLPPFLPEGFAEKEENSLGAHFNELQFSAGAIQQEQDNAMIRTPFFNNQEEYCYDITKYTCFNAYTP